MAGRFDSRIAAVAGVASTLHGQVIVVSGSNVPCIAGEFETDPELMDAGIRVLASLETDIVGTNMGTHSFDVGSLGTYDGNVLRVAAPKTSVQAGNVYRVRWQKA